jgi:hypothetical protein
MTDETTQDPTTEQPTPPATPLQLTDLLIAAQSIQLASSRGAFRPEEFSQVGGAYERIVAFLKDSGALQPQTTAEAPATTDAPAA